MRYMSMVGTIHTLSVNRGSPFIEIQDQRLLEIEMLLQIIRSPISVHFGRCFGTQNWPYPDIRAS